MKLDKTLNFKKARCVKGYEDCLEIGKEYEVIDISVEIKVKDDEGNFLYWESDYFEPVLDSAENPLQNIELTPEFEAVEPVLADNSANIQDMGTDILDTNADIKDKPKFKVGDKVYYFGEQYIHTYLGMDIAHDGTVLSLCAIDKHGEKSYTHPVGLCHATQENYERLQATFPDIEFEQPPTQADIDNEAVDKLAQAMKNKLAEKREQGYHGWETCKHGDLVQLLINHVDKGDPIDVANFCAFLFARGEPLTEAVLDE